MVHVLQDNDGNQITQEQANALMLDNVDWPKHTWDLPTDKDEFLRVLQMMGMSVDEFKQLPVYRWNVEKPELAWLKDL
jgi:hypothetical protein